MGIVLTFLNLFIFAPLLSAQGSLCASYDIEGSHPQQLGNSLVLQCMRQGSTFYLDGPPSEACK